MPKRVTMHLDEDAAARLVEMAGSQRKQGEFVSQIVNAMYENRETGGAPNFVSEDLRLKMTGVVAELGEMRSRLAMLERAQM